MPGLAILVMGVSGSGKSTIGELLADRLGAKFFDADDFHSTDARAKMHRGEPLNDTDRIPWLDNMYQSISQSINQSVNIVFAVSGLKLKYRLVLRGRLDAKYVDQPDWVKHVKPVNQTSIKSTGDSTNQSTNQPLDPKTICMYLLHGPFDVLLDRINQRKNHFFPPSLLQSQFDALELPIDQAIDHTNQSTHNSSNQQPNQSPSQSTDQSANQSTNQSFDPSEIRFIEDPVTIVDIRLGKTQIVDFIFDDINGHLKRKIEEKNDRLVDETIEKSIEQSNSPSIDAGHSEGLVEVYHPGHKQPKKSNL